MSQENGKKSIAISLIISLLILGVIFWQKDNLSRVISGFIGSNNGAVLSLSPSSKNVRVGDEFDANLYLDTAGNNVVALSANLRYDKNSFDVVSIDTVESDFAKNNQCVYQGKFCQVVKNDRQKGIVKIVEGKPTPGVNKNNILIASLKIKAKKETNPSSDNFSFITSGNDKSMVILDDGKGTDILTGVNNAKFSVGSVCAVGSPCQTKESCPGKYDKNCSCKDIADNCPAKDVLFADNFNDNNRDGWQIVPLNNESNNWFVVNGHLGEKSDNGNSIILAPNFFVPAVYGGNFLAEFKAKNGGNFNNGFGFVFGYKDENNYDMAYWKDPSNSYGNSTIQILKVNNGRKSIIAEKKGLSADNSWHSISVGFAKGKASISIDGKVALSAPVSLFSHRFGFYSEDNDSGVLFDDIFIKGVEVSTAKKIKRIKYKLEGRKENNAPVKIIVFAKGTNNIISETDLNVSASGEKDIDFSSIPNGNYDVLIKVPHYLPKKLSNILIKDNQNAAVIDFNNLLAGNIKDSDNVINSLDWSLMRSQWGRTDKPAADINQDGIVNSLDWYYLSKNWGKTSSN